MLCAVFGVLGAWFAMMGVLSVLWWSIMSVVSCHAVKKTLRISCYSTVGMPCSPSTCHPFMPIGGWVRSLGGDGARLVGGWFGWRGCKNSCYRTGGVSTPLACHSPMPQAEVDLERRVGMEGEWEV